MRRAPLIVLSVLALLLSGALAAAEDEGTPSPEQTRRRSEQILAHIERPEGEKGWLSHQLDRIHFNRQAGLAYTRPVTVAERELELSLRGPALDDKHLGLSLEIRF